MTEAFFSSFLMADEPNATAIGVNASRPSKTREGAPVSNETTRQRVATAFLQAVKEGVPDGTSGDRASEDLKNLAGAVADVALGHSVILQLKPGLAEGQRKAVRAFLETVVRISATLDETRLEAAIGKLAEVLLPDELAHARGPLAQDNLELRDRFIAQVPQLTSAEVGTQAGLQTVNPYATAARWKKAGDIIAVQHRGKKYFPVFQFREGRPHPTVKKSLAALPSRLSSWQRAFWFVSTNGWLGDKAPSDVLDDIQAVVAAAERESEEVVG